MRLALVLCFALSAGSASAAGPMLTLDAEVVWSEANPRFGGFSGIEMAGDGGSIAVISDRGAWARADLDRDPDGRLAGIRMTGIGPLRGIRGTALGHADTDAEGLAFDASGAAYVSFEGFHRIRRYADLDGPAEDVPSHPDFARLQSNSGLEALAIDAEGRLYAIPERSGALERPFPVYRLEDGRWDNDLRIRRDGAYLPVGTDFGPDGRLYLLERDFRWLGGFGTRIRSFGLGPDGFEDERLLLETGLGRLENMEGISVWRDPQGRIRLTLISDDNFFALQQTVVQEYVLTDG